MDLGANDTFNYLSVLFSVVIGLAATEVLQGVRGVLAARRRVVVYWPALVRAGALLLILAQTWWAMFGLRGHVDWTFGMYAAVLLQITLLYLGCALALPEPAAEGPVDLRAAYFAQSRPFYALLVAATVASVAKDVTIDGHLPRGDNLLFHGIFAVVGLIACLSKHDRVHKAVTATILLAFVAYVVVLFDRLPR